MNHVLHGAIWQLTCSAMCVEKPSDDGGSAVVEYIVERSISGGLFQEIYHGDDVTLPISSLFPGMEYHFRVAAVNSVGKGKVQYATLGIS